MKKLLILLTISALLFGCTTTASNKTTVGLGSISNVSATNATAEQEGSFEISTTYAFVVLENDIIKSLTFDTAQRRGKFDANGAIIVADAKEFQTKKELGPNYNIKHLVML